MKVLYKPNTGQRADGAGWHDQRMALRRLLFWPTRRRRQLIEAATRGGVLHAIPPTWQPDGSIRALEDGRKAA
jgi:hypothetical protein